jgi:hypothetical protein
MSPDVIRAPKSVSASLRKKQGQLIAGLIIGDRGAGKSRFLIELHKYNVEKAYEKLGYGKRTSDEWGKFWADLLERKIGDEEREKIIDAANHCLMLVIDFDLEGQEQLLIRANIMPSEISDSWEKWPVTGSSKDADVEEYEHQFEEGHRALTYYLQVMKEHNDKYPEFAEQRVLIVEDCGEVASAAMDYFFFKTTGGKTKTFAEHFANISQLREQTGEHKGLFQQGQRDTFGMINLSLRDYFHNCIMFKRQFGYNFYATARLASMKDEETGKLKSFATGKTYVYEGYFDIIITLIKLLKEVEGKSDGEKRKKEFFVIDTKDGAKNRLCPSFHMKNEGPGAFFRRLEEERSKDVTLFEQPKEKKKKKKGDENGNTKEPESNGNDSGQ